ncbi:MAG: HAMP domain-containing protein [Candidatus Sericytochromatia bacterium]|nr:HAMP domain-containing protein [Candidatus Tanganyikabacteria bacterium]
MSAGWKFVARVAALQVLVHVCAAAGFVAFLSASVVQYQDAFRSLFTFWLTGPLPLFLLVPLALAVPRTAVYERALLAAERGEPCPEPEASTARRQLLGQATYSAGMALVQWLANVVAGVAMLHWQNHESVDRLLSAMLAGVGVFTPLVAIAIWVATDRAVRPYFPTLFPDGRVAQYAVRRQTLDSRLLITFVLAGPVASGLMAAVAYVKSIDILTSPAQGYFHLQSMVGMMALALGGSFLVALIFKQILSHDLLLGLKEVTDALERIARGERGVSVPVRSADELGRLAEQTNALAVRLTAGEAADLASAGGTEAAAQALARQVAADSLAAERAPEATLAPPLP